MRALGIRSNGELDGLSCLEIDEPGGDGLLVEVRAAALNPADYKVISGKDGGRFLHAAVFPLPCGFDFSGVVSRAAGSWGEGQEVFGFLPYARANRQGSLSERVCVPADSVALKPPCLSHAEAAASATVGCTALTALTVKSEVGQGTRVLVNGASGGVGVFAVQLAKHLGASVTATCSAAKGEFVAGLGADEVIDYEAQAPQELPGPFDVVFDCASRLSVWQCRSGMAKGGTYITLLPSLSFATGAAFSWMVGRRCKVLVAQSTRSALERLAGLLGDGAIRTAIDDTIAGSAGEVAEGLRRLQRGDVLGKIAVDLAEGVRD